jgi:hypothetical protein
LIVLQKLAAAVKQSSALDVAAEVSFASFRSKLQKAKPVQQPPGPFTNPPTPDLNGKWTNVSQALSGNTPNRYSPLLGLCVRPGIRFAIAASMLLAMIPLIMQYGRSTTTTDYYTLSAAKPESPTGTKLRVVFSKSLPDADINSLLEKIHGQLVEGPNSVGAYTVRLGANKNNQDLTAAVALLRNQQNVLLVEPVIEP